jgi:hypothetical protein
MLEFPLLQERQDVGTGTTSAGHDFVTVVPPPLLANQALALPDVLLHDFIGGLPTTYERLINDRHLLMRVLSQTSTAPSTSPVQFLPNPPLE